MPGATIVALGTQFGGAADENGRFHLRLPSGRIDLLVSAIGYQPRKVLDVQTGGQDTLRVELVPAAIEMPGMVVSASRRSQTFVESPVSMSVAGAGEIAAHNAFTVTAPLRYVSGVSQIGGTTNIRGSSGFSRGTGSRVLLLLDGFPLLSADLGDIKWDAIPVTEVERIEVVKGAGSALYGSGALGGVINVLTRQPSIQPQTRLRLLSGFYSQPVHRSWRWSEDPMYLTGVDLSHSRTVGQTGLLLAAGHKRSTGYHENDDTRRFHVFAKAAHRFSPVTHLNALVNWAVDDHGVFIQWKDRLEPLAVPLGDRAANTVSKKLNLNTELYHLHNAALGYRIKGYYYRTGFENTQAAGGLTSDGHKVGGEIQTDYSGLERLDLTLGTSGAYDLVRSPGDFLGRRNVFNGGVYAQGMYQPAAQADVSLGLRYDYHRRDKQVELAGTSSLCSTVGAQGRRSEGQFSPQLGLSLRPRAGTALRSSLGRGFRAPSISEIFYQADISGILVCPNPAVSAERSWSYEVGVNQWVGNYMTVDVALFHNDYEGLVEGRADLAADTGATPVATFRNLSKARVRGVEIEQQAALPYGLKERLAYTYLDAVEFLGADEVLPPYCHANLVPGEEAPLPYRPRHLLNLALTATRGLSRIGTNFQYISRFERVSGLFSECGRDHLPVYLVDAFFARRVGQLELNLRVDNLLQYHYVLTERKIRPPRQVTLAVSGVL